MGVFRIDVEDLHWLENMDECEDLCLHGHARAEIGNDVLEYEATVSATALYLLKTLTGDHLIYEDNQMLPCCGFFYIADEACENVVISGCPNGIDWTVLHEGEKVRLIIDSGKEEIISLEEYRGEVFKFADKIEAFYKNSLPKKIPEDEFEKNGYLAFWNEWHRRRNALFFNKARNESKQDAIVQRQKNNP